MEEKNGGRKTRLSAGGNEEKEKEVKILHKEKKRRAAGERLKKNWNDRGREIKTLANRHQDKHMR